MAIPPEVAFERYVRDRTPYIGKLDLERVDDPAIRSLLGAIQENFNTSLSKEKRDVPEHVEHPPPHMDYIDSNSSNAHAFLTEDYSFIGVTQGLIFQLGDLCARLSQSDAAIAFLTIDATPDTRARFQAMLFQNVLSFVIAHEYTHHVHGNSREGATDFVAFDEIDAAVETGSLKDQIFEVDADGYATYHVLANLIDEPGRATAVAALKLEERAEAVQDEALFSSFVMVAGAFFFARPPRNLVGVDIYKLVHPPQAARLNYLMESAIAWCRVNQPSLVIWMTRERFQEIMKAVAIATWGMNGGVTWEAQSAFLESEAGSEYIRKLGEGVKSYVVSLGT